MSDMYAVMVSPLFVLMYDVVETVKYIFEMHHHHRIYVFSSM